MDEALMQDDGIDLIVVELDRCWEVTQDQDKSSKIEKALYETHSGPKTETTFVSHVTRRKLNLRQLESALGIPLPAVIKGYATPRDAKLTESSYDKVVMWTGGSYDYDDVMRALVRLDRPEMRPGTSGQSGRMVPIYFTDREADAQTLTSQSDVWNQPSADQPPWDEVLGAIQEDVDVCEDGETTIARDGATAIPGVFHVTDDGQSATVEENELPQVLLQGRPDTVPFERSSTPRRRLEVSRFLRLPSWRRWPRVGTAYEALGCCAAETPHHVCEVSQDRLLGSIDVQRGMRMARKD